MINQVVKLYQPSGVWNIPSPSPFCMKLETYMRMAKIPYISLSPNEVRKNKIRVLEPYRRMFWHKAAPKEKIPFIEYNGQLMGDSSLIIDYLKMKFGDTIDNKLTRSQRDRALLIQRMFEDHYFWAIYHSRWFDPLGWAVTNPQFFGNLPFLLRYTMPILRRKKCRKVLRSTGGGTNTQQELYGLAKQDLDVFAEILGNKAFVFGDEPTSIDAIAHAFLVNTLYVPFDYDLKNYAKDIKSFEPYCLRMNELFYSG